MKTSAKQFRGHVAVVAVAVLVSLAFVIVLLRIGGLVGDGISYSFRAMVPNSQDVYPGATVRFAGLQVGKVQTVTEQGDHAVLRIGVEDEYAPVHRDARVEVRLRTIAGENYVEIYPGSPDAPELPEDGTLPLSQAVQAVQVDQVLSVLDKPTQARAQQMFQGLAGGIGGRGEEVNDLVDQAAGVVDRAAPVTRVLAKDREQLASLIDGLGTLTSAVGRRGADIRLLSRQGRATAEHLAARDDAMRALLEELPPTLSQVRETTTTLRDVTGTAAPVLTATGGLVRELEPAVRSLAPAAQEGRAVLRELGRAAPPLRRTLAGVRDIAGPTAKALPPLRSTLCEANPLLEYIRPYAPELGVHLANLASAVNFYNATGHAARVHLMFSENSPVIFDPQTSQAVDRLLSTGILSQVREIGWNPYPEPGKIGDTEAGRNDTGPFDSSLPFERLTPAC